jgi:hypothetical protein
MPNYIIHKDGAYNFYTTITEGACYQEALTLEEVHDITRQQYGEEGLKELPARLERAHRTGCSGHDWTLDDCIESNRQGSSETTMPREEFIRRYLTLSPDQPTGGK